MFHVELRRFPNIARGFNLSAEELNARIVQPLVSGAMIDFDDRQWPVDRTRLKIYEGPAVAAEDRGLGRGWALVTRDGEDVTARLVEAAREAVRGAGPDRLKEELLAAAAANAVDLSEVVAAAVHGLPGRRASEALAAAEQAVWELLHEGSLRLLREDAEVPRGEWEAVLLAWESWATDGEALRLCAAR